MALDADPYRTLGLPRGATLAEVKKAYRRLAKAHHPDAAGEAALPRFLAIQAAYDQIVGPGSAAAGRPGTGRRSPSARQPWEADPGRADATHRAYGGRARRTGTRSGGSRPRPEPGPPPTGTDGSRSRPARPPNKATLGSTSYDGAEAEPFEPDWGGASWYGTTSGTYWTLNPREYADPRKHGPEYQARAWRAAASARGPGTVEAGDTEAGDIEAGPASPTHTTTSWWDDTAGGEPMAGPAATDSGHTRPSAWGWLEGDRPTLTARIGRAAPGWVPIALGIGWVVGELSGCGRFAADCDPTMTVAPWVAQVAVLVALLLAPRAASVAAIAGLVAVAVAVPGALLLSVTGGGPSSPAGGGEGNAAALGALLVVAWLSGAAVGLARVVRRGPRPVS